MARIHPIGPEYWSTWRSVRLRALGDSPEAFSSSYAEASGPKDHEAHWRGYFTPSGQNFLAIVEQQTVGQVRVVSPEQEAEAELMSLWVAPEARGSGLGSELVKTCWDWVQRTQPGRPLRLSVRRCNRVARCLYEGLGFIVVGPDPHDPSEDLLVKEPDS